MNRSSDALAARKCADMAVEDHIVFDDDNPEWTEADFVRARPADEVLPQALMAAFRAQRPGSVPEPHGGLTAPADHAI